MTEKGLRECSKDQLQALALLSTEHSFGIMCSVINIHTAHVHKHSLQQANAGLSSTDSIMSLQVITVAVFKVNMRSPLTLSSQEALFSHVAA